MRIFMFLLLALFSAKVQAEYRAFELVISNAESGNERTILSNLDPDQYPGYYPLAAGEKIKYVNTWMCWGRTGDGLAVCPDPKRSPASQKPNSQ